MSAIGFYELWPGGNTTALVITPFARARYQDAARKILSAHPAVEQVGFLEKSTFDRSAFRLQMAGGEFCGNAARAAAFWWNKIHGRKSVAFEVSGLDAVIKGETTPAASRIILPGAFFTGYKRVPEGWLIDLSGIRHLVVMHEPKADHVALMRKYRENFPAVGVIYLTRGGDEQAIDPYVWVRETGALFHETACGSGSIAAAIIISFEVVSGAKETPIRQPSGEVFSVVVVPLKVKGKFASFALSGPAKIQSTGSVQM